MTRTQHYWKAMTILREVEEAEKEAEEAGVLSFDTLTAWNANVQRKLKLAEVHMLGALVQKEF